MSDYTVKNLRDSTDQAAEHGLSDFQEARFPREDLGAEQTGVAHIVVHPDRRQPFAHRHNEAEEVYVVMRGGGRVKLDDELVEVDTLDAVRLSPGVTRQFEAGPDGLELLVFGPYRPRDAEMVQDFWTD
jgi:mannose-6-phosphate isomerase-like protein (cupin superfamily)